jgi:hypothetical protein
MANRRFGGKQMRVVGWGGGTPRPPWPSDARRFMSPIALQFSGRGRALRLRNRWDKPTTTPRNQSGVKPAPYTQIGFGKRHLRPPPFRPQD